MQIVVTFCITGRGKGRKAAAEETACQVIYSQVIAWKNRQALHYKQWDKSRGEAVCKIKGAQH